MKGGQSGQLFLSDEMSDPGMANRPLHFSKTTLFYHSVKRGVNVAKGGRKDKNVNNSDIKSIQHLTYSIDQFILYNKAYEC